MGDITVIRNVFNAETITSGTSTVSANIDIGPHVDNWQFSVQYYLQGIGIAAEGKINLGYKMSNDGVNFVYPLGGGSIGTSIASTSGVAANGRDIIEFTPKFGRMMQIEACGVSAAGTTNTLTLELAMQ